MFTLIIDSRYNMSGRNNNLSETVNRTRGRCGKDTHPNSSEKSKTSFRNIYEQLLLSFE